MTSPQENAPTTLVPDPLDAMLTERARLDRLINEERQQRKDEAIAKAKAFIAKHGLELADFFPLKPGSIQVIPTAVARTKVKSTSRFDEKPRKQPAVKYRSPINPELTWTGQGFMPRWLKDAVTSGHPLESFLVNAPAAQPTAPKSSNIDDL